MEKVINWFKENWFLWLFLILFYIGLRLSGYDIRIYNTKQTKPVMVKIDY
jgi:hypothetical protein